MTPFALIPSRIFTGERFLDHHAVAVSDGVIADVMSVADLPPDMVRLDQPG